MDNPITLMHRVQFEKPDLLALTSHFTVVDTHFHTRYSDGMNTIEEIVNKVEELGIGVAITDHNDIRGALEINQYKNILSIPGIEITSKEGTHLLVYFYAVKELSEFYKQVVKPHLGKDLMSSISLNLEDILKKAKDFDNLIVFPHPYSPAYTGVCNFHFSKERRAYLFSMIDGIEVINSENIRKANLKSAVLGFNLDKALLGGSDGHSVHHLGRAVCYAKCDKDRRAFLDILKLKQNMVMGKEIDIFRKVKSNSFKLRSSIKNCPNLVEKNLKYSWVVLNSKTKNLKTHVARGVNRRLKRKINVIKGLL